MKTFWLVLLLGAIVAVLGAQVGPALFDSYAAGAGNPDKLREAMRRAIPMGRIGQPEDIAGTILFLASDDAAYVTGQVISVSGGLTMSG